MNLKAMATAGLMATAPLPAIAHEMAPSRIPQASVPVRPQESSGTYQFSQEVAHTLMDLVGRCDGVIEYDYNPPKGMYDEPFFYRSEFIEGARISDDVLGKIAEELRFSLDKNNLFRNPFFQPNICMEELYSVALDPNISPELRNAVTEIREGMEDQLMPVIENN